MGKIVKKVDLEKAGIETRISKGDLADLMKLKLETKLDAEMDSVNAQIKSLAVKPTKPPRKYKKILAALDKLSPGTMKFSFDCLDKKKGQLVVSIVYTDRTPGVYHNRETRRSFTIKMIEEELEADPDSKELLANAREMFDLHKKREAIDSKLHHVHTSNFRNRMVQYSLESTEEGREVLSDIDSEIERIIEGE